MADDPEQPPSTDAKGRFLPGNKLGKGRAKGTPNKFGPGFREKLVNGITKAGIKKAKKAGRNEKVDGLEFYIEDLAANNSSAAATLISKLIPPESASQSGYSGPAINYIIASAAEGQQYLPGNKVLAPFEAATAAWAAYRAGPDAWRNYLLQTKSMWTQEAYDQLCAETAPEPLNPELYAAPRALAAPEIMDAVLVEVEEGLGRKLTDAELKQYNELKHLREELEQFVDGRK
jgi:hypothetical protein